jgi:predicted dehydrogenase
MTEPVSRRTFIGTSAAAAAAFAFPSGVFTQGSSVLRVGVIGCGGRGTGAARNCLESSQGIEVVAMGDLMPDRLTRSRAELAKLNLAGYKVTDATAFSGFDAYQRVLQSNVDLVILATPPGFRPAHLAAAVAAGKHIFTEKPVAVDPAGIRSVLATYEAAKQKNLAIVAGTQRRHEAKYLETIDRIHSGAIGEVMSGQVFWNQGSLWSEVQKAGWSDGEWQIRNWLYFAWLSGDHIVEQHVHNLDVANWVLQAHPVRAVGMGGRQSRVEQPRFGHIYDHFAIDYEYANGARVVSMCRQIAGTRSRIGESFIGTKGRTNTHNGELLPSDRANATMAGSTVWKFTTTQKPVDPYVQEHTDLVASIRNGRPLNELKTVAESTLTAIMGREAAYTGQELTWDEVLNADQVLAPPDVGFTPSMPIPPVPMPGKTKLVRKWNE